MTDPYNLQRFVDAQERVYARVVDELRSGRKRSHWMWFIFPQFEGLGRSWTARRYAIGSLEEARAYLEHPALGPQLLECVRLANTVGAGDPVAVFGGIDALKLRSSVTLFQVARPEEPVFAAALEKFYCGEPDARTLELLGQAGQ